jgi:hypothetical protein
MLIDELILVKMGFWWFWGFVWEIWGFCKSCQIHENKWLCVLINEFYVDTYDMWWL